MQYRPNGRELPGELAQATPLLSRSGIANLGVWIASAFHAAEVHVLRKRAILVRTLSRIFKTIIRHDDDDQPKTMPQRKGNVLFMKREMVHPTGFEPVAFAFGAKTMISASVPAAFGHRPASARGPSSPRLWRQRSVLAATSCALARSRPATVHISGVASVPACRPIAG